MDFHRRQSKYLQIYESLHQLISDDASEEERYLPSERELSNQYGVDRLTVRKALHLLLEEGLIRKHPGKGTVILPHAVSLNQEVMSRSVAFILPRGTLSVDRITEPFHANLFYLIGKELKARGCNLLYATIGSEGALPPHLLESGVMGFIFVSQVPQQALNQAFALQLPITMINRVSERYPVVLEDRYNTARLALEHLYSLGHRNIAFINGVSGYYTTETCKQSYADFMETHPDVDGLMVDSYWNFENGMTVMKRILKKGAIPTAVCGCNAAVALGAMEAVKKAGIRVPQDLSVVGFDETEQCIQFSPTLTSVGVDIPLLARIAVERLFSIVEHGNPGPLKTIIPVCLNVRESTGIASRAPGDLVSTAIPE